MKVELENVKPMEIEKRSFEIITEELGDTPLIPGTELIVKRCIHTSADFDYAKNLCFSEGQWRRQWTPSAAVPASSQIPRCKGRDQQACTCRYGGEATASCPTRMWLPLQKRTGLPEPQPAWTRQQRWIKS